LNKLRCDSWIHAVTNSPGALTHPIWYPNWKEPSVTAKMANAKEPVIRP
uniref:DUF551 domain-containing protein n=1 Tax=Haemonchus placei TaxID=6290 RepID=A0A0N4VXQ4_HAEPC